jgi:hypothetical protein
MRNGAAPTIRKMLQELLPLKLQRYNLTRLRFLLKPTSYFNFEVGGVHTIS